MMANTSFVRYSRRSLLAIGLMAAPLLASTSASAAVAPTAAEAWVQQNIQQGLQILNKKQPAAKRRTDFEGFLLNLIDFRKIAIYTLGRGAVGATPAQIDEFVTTFQHFAEATYEHYLLQYSGQTLKIVGSLAGPNGDTVVRTILVDPHNPNGGSDPYEVDFRVYEANGKFLIKDAAVQGVWLAHLEHDDFEAFLGDNRMSLQLLLDHIKKQTAQMQKAQG
jgi:ABC-type transporter MlaC component